MSAAPGTTSTGFPDRRYLRQQDLRRLRHLTFFARRFVEGRYAGRHASPQRGHSVEFTDYRQYIAGDDINEIDWKVYGRSDKLFIKLFEHQTDLTVNLLVDGSASMGYRGMEVDHRSEPPRTGLDQPSKYDLACLMAAAIAFLAVKQQDNVAFGVSRNGLRHFHRSGGSFFHLDNLLKTMEQVRPAGRADLSDALRDIARRTHRKGLFVLFSDLLEDRDLILDALGIFPHRGSEVIVFHTLHADELRLPDLAEAVFVDSETEERVRLNVDDVAPAYESRLKQFLERWQRGCAARGIAYNLASTSVPYHQTLERYLVRRANLK